MELTQEQQEIIFRASQLEQESQQAQQQLEMIESQLKELDVFQSQLLDLASSKQKELLTPLGRGVHIKTSLEEDRALFVEVGAGIVVKKTAEETKEVIKSQLSQLREARIHIMSYIESVNSEIMSIVQGLKQKKESA